MAQEFVRVRMLRHIDAFVHVLELEQGQLYDLTRESAEKLINAGSAELAPPKSAPRLEAAALAAPSRRG
jgi:hypothetical protein